MAAVNCRQQRDVCSQASINEFGWPEFFRCFSGVDPGLIWGKMGVSENSGTPKWMVYNGKPIKMDDLGVPLFSETPK